MSLPTVSLSIFMICLGFAFALLNGVGAFSTGAQVNTIDTMKYTDGYTQPDTPTDIKQINVNTGDVMDANTGGISFGSLASSLTTFANGLTNAIYIVPMAVSMGLPIEIYGPLQALVIMLWAYDLYQLLRNMNIL